MQLSSDKPRNHIRQRLLLIQTLKSVLTSIVNLCIKGHSTMFYSSLESVQLHFVYLYSALQETFSVAFLVQLQEKRYDCLVVAKCATKVIPQSSCTKYL